MTHKFKHIFINGCSHTAGSEIEGSTLGDSEYNRVQCFGAQLARRLGVDYTNVALPGGSNDYIFRTTNFWIQDNIELAKQSLFLINWTGAARAEYFHNGVDNNNWYWMHIPFVPDEHVGHLHPNSFSYINKHDHSNATSLTRHMFMSEPHWQINRYMNILNLQSMLKVHNIPYIFKNALEFCSNDTRYQYYSSRIDRRNYKGYNDESESFFEHCLDAGFSIEGQLFHHHKIEAHTYWADKLFRENFS
jgi:hypothetical protein